jgi:RimJ/RimL family protein N-acetyltransferase
MKTLETPRLLLRPWSDEDVVPFYAMGQDPQVMEYFPSLWSMDMVKQFIERMNVQLADKTFTLWAVEEKSTKKFGLSHRFARG